MFDGQASKTGLLDDGRKLLSRTVYRPPAVLGRLRGRTELLACVAFGLYVLAAWLPSVNLDEDALELVQTVLQVPPLLLLALLLALREYTLRHVLVLGISGVFVAATTLATGSKLFFWLWLLVAALRGERFCPLAATVAVVCGGLLVIVPTGFLAGLIEPIELYRASGEVRSSLGFTHPNTLMMLALVFMFAWFAVRFDRLRWFDWTLAALLLGAAYAVSDSRTSLAVGVLFLALAALFKSRWGARAARPAAIVGIAMLVVFSVACVALMVAYDPESELLLRLNSVLSGRLYWANYYYATYSLSLFGIHFVDFPELYAGTYSTFIVDMGYCRLLLGFGFATFIGFLGLVVMLLFECFKEHYRGIVLIGLLAFILWGVVERQLFYLEYNFFLLAFTCLLDDRSIVKFCGDGSSDDGGCSESAIPTASSSSKASE